MLALFAQTEKRRAKQNPCPKTQRRLVRPVLDYGSYVSDPQGVASQEEL